MQKLDARGCLMPHEPGRERHMTYRCEKCGKASSDLCYRTKLDEYWCGFCIDNEAFEQDQPHVDH